MGLSFVFYPYSKTVAEEKAKPVYELMKAELTSGSAVHADETNIQVLHNL